MFKSLKAFKIIIYIGVVSFLSAPTDVMAKNGELVISNTEMLKMVSVTYPAQLLQQFISEGGSGSDKLGPLVLAYGKPVTDQHSDKDPCASSQLRGFAENAMNVIECVAYLEHQAPVFLKLFLWFIFGVLCGYGSFSPRRTPNFVLDIKMMPNTIKNLMHNRTTALACH